MTVDKKLHVKRGDTVVVLSGKDKGKRGKVLEAAPKEGKVIIEGVSVASKHLKPRQMGQAGGIVDVEAPIYACKVMLVCPKCQKPTRLAHKTEAGKKQRLCKKCNATF